MATKKKKSKTSLRNKADKLFSKHWREKIGKCEHCGSTKFLQLAHITSRGCIKLRFERKNTLVLCAGCHIAFHKKPLEFSVFVGRVKGSNIVDELIRESTKLEPIREEFYQKVIDQYGG